uniref:Uncharacterized protein n=1 Tax=Anguilla anguilla TaxID=7936 RepID=A0A0E9SWQ9_ANGAN
MADLIAYTFSYQINVVLHYFLSKEGKKIQRNQTFFK